MMRTRAASLAIGALASVVAMVSLVTPVRAAPPVVISSAGSLIGWGIDIAPGDAYTLPTSLRGTPFSRIIAGAGFSIALTAAGKVVVLGRGYAHGVSMAELPASVADATVVDVAAGGFSAAAVTAAGKVEVWGLHSDFPDAADVPEGLSGVRSVAVSQGGAAAVKADGMVVAWGGDRFGETAVPHGLTDVVSLTAGDSHYYALKADGTVVGWGSNAQGETTLPHELTAPGNVEAVAARSAGGLALLANGSLVSWGHSAGNPGVLNGVPESLDGKNVVAISALSNNNMALDDEGAITIWGAGIDQGAGLGMGQLQEIPNELAGAQTVGIAMGDEHAMVLVIKVLEVRKPTITGTPRVGNTLTGASAIFSGAPEAVSNQWLADGVPIAGATDTSLRLIDSHAGKRITFISTAAKLGEGTVVSVSEQTAVVDVERAPSTVVIRAARINYGNGGKVTVSVGNSLARAVTGTVQLAGAGPTRTAAVSQGVATFTLDRALAAGRYRLLGSYSGNSEVAASLSAMTLVVLKAKGRAPTLKMRTTPTPTKRGRAVVQVSSRHGLATASGRVTLTLSKGKATKVISGHLSVGARSVILPRLKKGTWRARVRYAGDGNYVAQTSKAYGVKVKP